MNTPESDPSRSQPSGLQVELGAKGRRHRRGLWLMALLASLAIATGVTLIGRSPSPSPLPLPATPLEQSSATQPGITWSNDSIDVILSPRESASRSIAFTSSTDLSNIVIEAVPAIAPFLTIKPNTLSRIRANRSEKIQVSFAIPTTATLGDYDGTIHIRVGSQTLPKALKVSTRVWRLFADADLRLTVLFPPSFNASLLNPTTVGFSKEAIPTEGDVAPEIEISIWSDTLAMLRDRLLDRFQSLTMNAPDSVGALTGYRIVGLLKPDVFGWGGTIHGYFMFESGGRTAILEYDAEDTTTSDVANQMLLTIRVD